MILLTHIAIALAGLIVTTYTFFLPSQQGIRLAEMLVGLTVVSGVALIIVKPQNWAHVCLMGLIYVAVAAVGVYAAQKKVSKPE